MQSPLKGLERLTEELRLERIKCTDALQEVSKLRVEIATVTQENDELQSIAEELNQQVSNYQAKISELQSVMQDMNGECEALKEECDAKHTEYQIIFDQKQSLQEENDHLQAALHDKDSQIAALSIKCRSIENRAASKDDLVSQQAAELEALRNSHAEMEQQMLDAIEALKQEKTWNVELKLELGRSQTMSAGYEQTRSSNDQLRAELDAALKSEARCREELKEMATKLREKTASETALEETIRTLKAEKDKMAKEFASLEATCAEYERRVKAESEACEAAKDLAQTVAQGRDFINLQLHEVQEKHQASMDANTRLEKELTEHRATISELQAELSAVREKLVQAEAGAEQGRYVQAVMQEMESLRGQLTELRREKVRREVEEDAGVIAPQAVQRQVQENRAMYEGVIHQLRQELEAATNTNQELTRRCSEEQRRAHRLQSLEEELVMYKELVRQNSVDNQDAALAISEEKNRSLKILQEKTQLLHRLHRSEADLVSARAEVTRANEEITELREKIKSFHSLKMASEKKVAEVSTANLKTGTALEELKQKYDAMSLELEKARRAVQEQTFTISDLRIKSAETDAARADTAALSAKLVQVKTDAARSEKELTLQIETLRHQKASIERELQSSREKVSIHRSAADSANSELTKLRAEYDTIVTERDRLRRTMADNEAQHTEQQLFDLKRQVEETTKEYRDFESERSAKDKIIQQITAECSREREKVTMLKLQLATLEDKLRVANQELSVFRGIDVYHSSYRAQLQTFRHDRSFNDSALDMSAIKGEPRTERDLGSAFANSINLGSTQRPPSRGSNRADESEEEGPYMPGPPSRHSSRSPSPHAALNQTAPAASAAAVDLMKPSSPILRPPAMSATAPVYSRASAPSAPVTMAPALQRSNSARRGTSPRAARNQDEMDTRSVASDRGAAAVLGASYAAEETKSDNRAAGYDSNIFSFTRPVPRSPSNPRPGPSNDESIIVDDAPPPTQTAVSPTEAERREIMRRRAERKALRDQQLRDRILRGEHLNSSFAAHRGGGGDVRDDLSQSSVSSATSGLRMHSQAQAPAARLDTSRSAAPAATARQETPATAPSRRHTMASVGRTGATSPIVGVSRITALAQKTSLNNTHLSTAANAAPAAAAGAPYRPAGPDYARARRLLNM